MSDSDRGYEVRQQIREMNLETDHPDPGNCPSCGSIKTRALDHSVATCFDCDADWYIDTGTDGNGGDS